MADNKFSIINLDGEGTSNVVIKLLDMIEHAVGWVMMPKGSKHDFEEGLEIYKKSIIEDKTLTSIEKGAKISKARKELKQYINQGKIISYAVNNIRDDAKMNIDDDWLLYFFEYAKNISNENIQQIWGKILSEQFNGDTSISRKLIHTLSLLDSDAALNFGKLCNITIGVSGANNDLKHIDFIPFIFWGVPKYKDTYEHNKFDLEYIKYRPYMDELRILEEYGLITISSENPYIKYLLDSTPYTLLVGEQRFEISTKMSSDNSDIYEKAFGNVRYTAIGVELYKLIEKSEYCNEIRYVLKRYFDNQGVIMEK